MTVPSPFLQAPAAGAFGGADGFAVFVAEAGVEEGAPVVDPAAGRRQVGEAVARQAEMGPGARPAPGFRPVDQARPYRVELGSR
ncbi:MAG: hypothetical protein ACXWU6_00420 [Allosphingosinicella sp.]